MKWEDVLPSTTIGLEQQSVYEKVILLGKKLEMQGSLTSKEFLFIFNHITDELQQVFSKRAHTITVEQFGKKIYGRALIEITNYCKNNCFYCGIRASNLHAKRYRLTKEEILSSAQLGYENGLRTFVLQGGEDYAFTDDLLVEILIAIKEQYPDCAITLSLGERSQESYKKLRNAGADRYLLRHETITNEHYGQLHPQEMSLANRVNCLYHLKNLQYQVGTGIMVGTPQQTVQHIADDMEFICRFRPQMVGVGPFLPHKDTPFGKQKKGDLKLTLLIISLLRLMDKQLLIPSTTALATLDSSGRRLGILAGANVIMPNVSPSEVREKYMLYNDKVRVGEGELEAELQEMGYTMTVARGDNWSQSTF